MKIDGAGDGFGAVRQTDRDARVWLKFGRARHESPGMQEKARAPLERAIALGEEQLKVNPRDAGLLADLADAHAMLGHLGPALALSGQALKLAPDDGDVLRASAEVDEALGRREAALRKVGRALAAGCPRWEIERSPSLATLRQDRRYADVLKGAGPTTVEKKKKP